MDKSQLIRTIAKELSEYFLVAEKPDHPYILTAPDLLLASPGKLVSVFLPYQLEIRYPDKLLVRLASSRLALPPHMRCVLILSENKHIVNQTILRNFDEIIDENSYRDLVSITRDSVQDQTRKKHIRVMQLNTYRRCNYLLNQTTSKMEATKAKEVLYTSKIDVSNLIDEFQKKIDYKPIFIPSWSHPERKSRKSRNIIKYKNSHVSGIKLRGSKSKNQILKSYFEGSIKTIYVLDNGVPYLKPNFEPNVMLVDEYPLGRFDILKPIRTAAFAGWTVLRTFETDEIHDFILNLNRKISLYLDGFK